MDRRKLSHTAVRSELCRVEQQTVFVLPHYIA